MEKIIYGFYQSSLGEMVLAKSQKGLCWLGFMVKGYKGDGLERMKQFFKGADFERDDEALREFGDAIMYIWRRGDVFDISLDLRGTPFQISVWTALLKIQKGARCSYGDIANMIGKPNAVRAVGSAVGENPVSLLIPCHRVVQKSGGLGNYGWGVDLKRKILEIETL